MVSASTALQRLRDGNARFAEAVAAGGDSDGLSRSLKLPQEQTPFAIILGCSDARVPAEIVFDQGPGDLFVIRVAGNIVAPSQLGSIEFAAQQFGTRLVVVLGHTRCGAVQATVDALRAPDRPASRNLRSIVSFIRPAVEPLLGSDPGDDEQLVEAAVRENVRASVEGIVAGSDILADLVANDGLQVVGAEYGLKTGTVDFFLPADK